MLMHAVDRYLAIRRAAGFALIPIEGYLRHFARFATARGDTHVVATTAIAWADLGPLGSPTPLPVADGGAVCPVHGRRGPAA